MAQPPIDHEKFQAVQNALHPLVFGKPSALEALPDDISTASLLELAGRFDAQVGRLLDPEVFQGDLPPGSKAATKILPGEVKLELELGRQVRQGPFPPHPGWYAKRNILSLSKDQPSEREEPLVRKVSIWTEESASPWLGISEAERLKNIQKTQGVNFTHEAFVGVPLNVPILAVLGLPFNHYDKATVRVNVAPDRLPNPDKRLAFAVGILLLNDMLSSQLEPAPKTKR